MTCTTCEDGHKPVLNGLCTNPACEFHPHARPPASGFRHVTCSAATTRRSTARGAGNQCSRSRRRRPRAG